MSDYDPFIYDNVENAAFNIAENIWSWTPFFVHHVIPLTIYSAYLGFSIAKGFLKKIKDFSDGKVTASVVPTTAPRSGSMMNTIRLISKHIFIFLGIQKLADLTKKLAYWDEMKPAGVAFLRGVLEKLMPFLVSVFDRGDVNFSARQFVFKGGYFSSFAKGLRSLVRSIVNNGEIHFGEKVAPEAYYLGQHFSESIVHKVNLTKSVLVTSYQAMNCFHHKLLGSALGGEEGSCAKMHEEYQTIKPLVDAVSGSICQIANDTVNAVWNQTKEQMGEHPYFAGSALAVGSAVGMYFGWSAIKAGVFLVKAKTWDYFYPKVNRHHLNVNLSLNPVNDVMRLPLSEENLAQPENLGSRPV